MATNGVLNTNACNGRYLQLTWSAAQNVAENTSTVSWILKGAGTCTESGVSYYDAGAFTVVLDGETVYASESSIRLFNGTQVASGTKVLHHNASGSRAFSASVSAVIGTVSCAGSGSWALTPLLMTDPPTILGAYAIEGNPLMTELTGDPYCLVRFYSDIAVSAEAVAQNGVGIASLTAVCEDGQSVSSDSGILIGTIYGAESGNIMFTAVDNRGNRTRRPVPTAMIPYVKLTCSLENTKPSTDGNMTVKISGNYYNGTFGAVDNRLIAVEYRYKTSGGTFCDWLPALSVNTDGNSYMATAELSGLDYHAAYVFQARAMDTLMSKIGKLVLTPEYPVKAMPVFDWGEKDFNVNGTLKIGGAPLADFVVEQGTDGVWAYRKWNSGRAECWGYTNMNSGVMFSAGSIFHSDPIEGIGYPQQIAFLEAPSCFASLSVGIHGAWLAMSEAGTAVKTPGYIILAPQQNVPVQLTVEYRAIGRWK